MNDGDFFSIFLEILYVYIVRNGEPMKNLPIKLNYDENRCSMGLKTSSVALQFSRIFFSFKKIFCVTVMRTPEFRKLPKMKFSVVKIMLYWAKDMFFIG